MQSKLAIALKLLSIKQRIRPRRSNRVQPESSFGGNLMIISIMVRN